MAVKPGWTGRVYEDFKVGDVYQHPLGRTLLDADNTWFTLLTQNTNPIHFDDHYSSQTEFKKPLINSCLTLAVMQEGADITTIEGLGTPEALHPMQAAFIENDAFQCGYCTPGQICSAVAMLGEHRQGQASAATRDLRGSMSAMSDDEIRERMSGNICRCGAYPNIVAAVRSVAQTRGAQTFIPDMSTPLSAETDKA